MTDRVRPTSPDDPFKKGKIDKSDELDDEKKRIEKAREVDPEEKKRRKFQKHLEKEEKTEESAKKPPSPYESKFHEKSPYEAKPTKEKGEEKISEKKEGIKEGGGKLEEEKKEYPSKERVEKEHPTKEAKEVKSTTKLPEKPQERIEQHKFEKKEKTEEEKKPQEESAKGAKETIPVVQPIPLEIAQRAAEITNDLKVYLNPEIAPLFEQMVGRMVIMSAQEGIMQTEVELTGENFEGSVFYGSKILLEKYSTAPDSFNIQLTGNPQAVAAFNANLDSLMESFRRSNLNFRVGRLEAAYETTRPLFRRKKPPTTSGEGEGSVR